MINITTQDKSVYINGSKLVNKGAFTINVDSTGGYIQLLGFSAVKFDEVELDGQTYSNIQDLVAALDKVFRNGGGSGEGLQSIVPGENVTVDDSDPLNPVISATGGGAVASVNGKTGPVVLTAADVEALPDTYSPSAEDISNATTLGINILKGLDASTVRTLLELGTIALLSLNGNANHVFKGDGNFGLVGSGNIANNSIVNANINSGASISLSKLGNVAAGTDGLSAGTIQATFQALATRIAALESSAIKNDAANSTSITAIRRLTQAEYDAITTKNPSIIYIIEG